MHLKTVQQDALSANDVAGCLQPLASADAQKVDTDLFFFKLNITQSTAARAKMHTCAQGPVFKPALSDVYDHFVLCLGSILQASRTSFAATIDVAALPESSTAKAGICWKMLPWGEG